MIEAITQVLAARKNGLILPISSINGRVLHNSRLLKSASLFSR